MPYPVDGQSVVTDIVFDEGENLLLIATSDGNLAEWDPASGKIVKTISLGGHLGGLAVIGDGAKVLISQHASDPTTDTSGDLHNTDTIYRLDVETSSYETIRFTTNSGALGVIDVAVDRTGQAFATTSATTTSPVPLLGFDATAGAPSIRPVSVPSDQPYNSLSPDSYLIPSETGRYILIMDNAGSSVPVDIYDSETRTFIAHKQLGFSYDPETSQFIYPKQSSAADISDAAKLTAFLSVGGVAVFDFNLKIEKYLFLENITGSNIIGVHFSVDGKDLFVWDNGEHAVRVLDVGTWSEVGRIALNNDDFFNATDFAGPTMALGQNGHLLFLRTQSGFAPIDLDRAGFGPRTAEAGIGGTYQADNLTGQGTADTLSGFGGDDTLNGGQGSDVLNGGPGVDTATFAGFAHDYALALSGGAGTVSGGREGGADTLTSIENVQFLDGELTFDTGSTAAQILRLYDSFLGRSPDAAGFQSYLRYVQAGHSFQDMAANAAASPEFANATAGLSDAQYITYVYEHSLHREPDAYGLQQYEQALHDGTLTRTSMIVQAAESPEHVALTAGVVAQGLWVADEKVESLELLYDAAVQRQPDATGIAGYGALIASGTSYRQIANQMSLSAEFQAAHSGQSDAQYIDSLYVAEVGRHADPTGMAAYLDQLAHGYTRGDILWETAFSAEHQSHVLAYADPLLG